jgi:uncharacterized membrane protein
MNNFGLTRRERNTFIIIAVFGAICAIFPKQVTAFEIPILLFFVIPLVIYLLKDPDRR